MKGIKYVGAIMDHSGYGEASRNYVFSLYERGIPITVSPRNFEPNPPPIADEKKRAILDKLINKQIDYDIVLIHLTPDLYPMHAESGKYNIGYVAWETSLFHPKWVNACSVLNEIWVPCQWNVEAVRNSDISIPVYKIPHGIDPGMFDGIAGEEFSIPGLDKNTFKFYSIFQWIYRKNPEGLLRAYFNAFTDRDDVAMILKAYRIGGGRDKGFMRDAILEVKKDMNIGAYPKVMLIGDSLSKTQMLGLHMYGDCCVGLHRGEGWGLPLFEAGLAGKPVIATGCGGNTEFMTEDNSYLVDYQMTFVSGMSSFNPWYLGNQEWAEPNLISAAKAMQQVYVNREESGKKGQWLKQKIVSEFSWDRIADLIIDRLISI